MQRSTETMIVGVILAAILTRMKSSDAAMKNAKRVRTSSYSLELGSHDPAGSVHADESDSSSLIQVQSRTKLRA